MNERIWDQFLTERDKGCIRRRLTATRVLVSEEHVHLLREGADGIVKPSLRDAQGRFVENADLIRVPSDFAGAIAAIAINAALAARPLAPARR
jgi:hypothetical protein